MKQISHIILLITALSLAIVPSFSFKPVLPSITGGGRLSPIHIWDGTPVRAHSVTLVPYLPVSSLAGPKGWPAIIVCPGGSYCWHDYQVEGLQVAKWLSDNGIAAFVLKYRVQGIVPYITHSRLIIRGHRHPDSLCDIQRAIQYVREHSREFGIDPSRLGAMGFSAGGHLVMSAAAYAATDFLAPLGITHDVSLRPDFVAPIYPVVTMQPPFVHKRSRRGLLGEYRKYRQTMRDSMSLEKHIPADCPPVFLLNCVDDPIVQWQNSVLLDSALTDRGIPHLYIQYQVGGHGFGTDRDKFSQETSAWQNSFLQWFKNL